MKCIINCQLQQLLITYTFVRNNTYNLYFYLVEIGNYIASRIKSLVFPTQKWWFQTQVAKKSTYIKSYKLSFYILLNSMKHLTKCQLPFCPFEKFNLKKG